MLAVGLAPETAEGGPQLRAARKAIERNMTEINRNAPAKRKARAYRQDRTLMA
jgi:hypothetical protein